MAKSIGWLSRVMHEASPHPLLLPVWGTVLGSELSLGAPLPQLELREKIASLLLSALLVGLGDSCPVPFKEVLLRCSLLSELCLCFYTLSWPNSARVVRPVIDVACVGFPYGICLTLTLVSETECGGAQARQRQDECSRKLWITPAAVFCRWNRADRKPPTFIHGLNLKETFLKLLVLPSLSRVFGGPTVSNW